MSIAFAETTTTNIMMLLSAPLTGDNYTVVIKILADIAAIDSGALVAQIESLVGEILAIKANAGTAEGLYTAGMIQADLVHWRQGAASGAIARYRQLLTQLFSLLGLPNPNDGSMSMVRSDRYSLASSGGNNRYVGGIYEDWSYLAW